MTAKRKSSRSPAAAPIRAVQERAAPSVDGLLSMLDLSPLDAERAPEAPSRASGPGVGKVVGIDSQGRPLVAFAGSAAAHSAKQRRYKIPAAKGAPDAGSIPARSTVRVTAADAGREALIAFEDGDRDKPIIIGLLQAPEDLPARIELQAGKEMVLKCGPASITLTKDGRIVIRGADVLTRSSGSNRIKGGSVHIN